MTMSGPTSAKAKKQKCEIKTPPRRIRALMPMDPQRNCFLIGAFSARRGCELESKTYKNLTSVRQGPRRLLLSPTFLQRQNFDSRKAREFIEIIGGPHFASSRIGGQMKITSRKQMRQ